MNRKDFLKGVGLAGIGLALPNSKMITKSNRHEHINAECTLVPSEIAGPFPLDLTENSFFFRQDLTEGQPGVPLKMRIRILGTENCEPMQNVRVHIWHCSNTGVYSGYNVGSNPGDENATHLRGYQITDANGEVEFDTIFPGIYPGRICHVHFQVHVSSSYAAVSQFTFPVDTKNTIYANNPSLYPSGTDPVALSQDMSFSDGYAQQMATLEKNSSGGYDSFLEVSVKGSGTTGIGHIERETAKVFELGQNFPNPYRDKTSIPVILKQRAHLQLELWDLSGRKVATVLNEQKGAGEYIIEINLSKLGLPTGSYVYQLVANTGNSTYRLPKMMTVKR